MLWSRFDENFAYIFNHKSFRKYNFISEVQFSGIGFVKVFSSFMHSLFCHIKTTYLDELLRLFILKVLFADKIVENIVSKR